MHARFCSMFSSCNLLLNFFNVLFEDSVQKDLQIEKASKIEFYKGKKNSKEMIMS